MRGQDERHALLLQPEEPVPHDVTRLRIEPGRGLVEQQHVRVVHERAGDRQPALHAARKRLDFARSALVQLDELEQPVGACSYLAARQSEVAAVDDQVLAHRQLVVERVLLWNDAQAAANLRAVGDGVQVENAERPRGRRRDAADHAHGRALPRSVRAEKAERFAALHVEVDPVDRDEIAELLQEPAGMDKWRTCAHVRRLSARLF